ncbi:cell wall-binding protein [Clostridium beijerinckii]|nr:cell wall-binding protein [Clostridium beijerinckii]
MNKNIKRIIAITLAISNLAVIEPSRYIDLLTTRAYSAELIEGISDLEVCKNSGSTELEMYKDSDYDNSTEFKDDITKYYIELSESTGKFNIRADVDSGYSVKVIDESDDDEEYDLEDEISIKAGDSKTVSVEITKNSDSSNQKVTIKLRRKEAEDDDEEDNDKIYLSDLTLSHGEDYYKLNFAPKNSLYNINVPADINYIKIEAKPDDRDEDKVNINGISVHKDDDYSTRIPLNMGKNEINITVKNDEDERTYIINITRGNNAPSNIDSNNKTNKWIQNNGKWQYIDSSGNIAKNLWVQNYYLTNNGDMATEWLNYNGSWYYLGSDGAFKAGWKLIGGNWYCFDSIGKIKIGWFKDSDGKWYYLNSFGAMAYNTMVDGYRLGNSGAWVK